VQPRCDLRREQDELLVGERRERNRVFGRERMGLGQERDEPLAAYWGELQLGDDLGAQREGDVDAAVVERPGHHISCDRSSTSGWLARKARPRAGSVSKRVLHE
jgi:hypothetical protein